MSENELWPLTFLVIIVHCRCLVFWGSICQTKIFWSILSRYQFTISFQYSTDPHLSQERKKLGVIYLGEKKCIFFFFFFCCFLFNLSQCSDADLGTVPSLLIQMAPRACRPPCCASSISRPAEVGALFLALLPANEAGGTSLMNDFF